MSDLPGETNRATSCLTEDLFRSIISKYFTTKPFKINKLNHSDLVADGNNFVSKVYKNSIQIEQDDGMVRDFAFVSKIMGLIMDEKIVDQMGAFPKEIGMYRDVVPEFEQIMKDVAGIDINFGPKLYYSELKPKKMLIFENLNESGYKVANRFKGLTEAQVLLVMEKISKWHAVSRVYCERHVPIDNIMKKGLINEGTLEFLTISYNRMFDTLVETLSATDIDESHLAVIKTWKNKIGPTLHKVTTPVPDEFNVLNHGDLWLNNMLFLDDDAGTPIDVKFIDLQLGNYGSPALDLIYFLVASVRHELFAAKFDDFVAHYHKHLVATLKRLNQSRIPTLKEIHIQIIKRAFYSTIMLCGGLASTSIDCENDDIQFLLSNEQTEEALSVQRKKMFEIPRILNNLLGLFKFMGNRGMLDIA